MSEELFNKYPSIENHFNSKFIERVRRDVPEDEQWVAREKIHGTNFQIIKEPDSKVSYARRSGVLGITDSFFDYHNVMRKYNDSIACMVEDYENVTINIHGELAGEGIQSNIPYGEKDFYVFDVSINGNPLSDYDVDKFCKTYGFKIAPFVKKGSLETLLTLNPEFKSLVHSQFDVVYGYEEPVIEFTDSGEGTSEGYVLKPMKPTVISTGGRAMIKLKSDSHQEKKNVGKVAKPKVEMTDKDMIAIDELSQYITLARVENVYSHGEVELTNKTFGKLAGLVLQDIFSEYKREYDSNPIEEADHPPLVSKYLMGEIFKEVVVLFKNL